MCLDEADKASKGAVTWTYSGRNDVLVGTGATGAERMIGYGTAAVLTAVIVGADLARDDPIAATVWQIVVLTFFAYDIAGGAVANMLNSCKRLYHSAPMTTEGAFLRVVKNAKIFTAIHVHPILIALALGGSIAASIVWYLLLQISVWLVLAAPIYLRRAIATAFTMLAILCERLVLPLGSGLEWVIPALFIKMVMGHTVQEEPYAARSQMPAATR